MHKRVTLKLQLIGNPYNEIHCSSLCYNSSMMMKLNFSLCLSCLAGLLQHNACKNNCFHSKFGCKACRPNKKALNDDNSRFLNIPILPSCHTTTSSANLSLCNNTLKFFSVSNFVKNNVIQYNKTRQLICKTRQLICEFCVLFYCIVLHYFKIVLLTASSGILTSIATCTHQHF